MSTNTQPNNPPAFPVTQTPSKTFYTLPPQPGITLRDWFAGQALNGYLSAGDNIGDDARTDPERAALWAYEQADAMLRAREGKP